MHVPSWAVGCGFAGHAVNPPPGPGPAASGCAFSRTRGSASQAVRLHPWRLVENIHVFYSPANPPPPTLRQRGGGHGKRGTADVVGSCLGRRSAGIGFSRGNDTLSKGGSGRVCGGVSRMDAATKPPWTDSRRPPQTRTDPPKPDVPSAARLFAQMPEAAGQRPALRETVQSVGSHAGRGYRLHAHKALIARQRERCDTATLPRINAPAISMASVTGSPRNSQANSAPNIGTR